MRLVCWNMRRASKVSTAWDYLEELNPDVALLQEVGAIPTSLTSRYATALEAPTGRTGRAQRFHTALLVRGEIGPRIKLSSPWPWVDDELATFRGNLLAHEASVAGRRFRVLSAYSPAWPVDPARLSGVDVSQVKLQFSSKVWVTELLWAALAHAPPTMPWIVGGDLNSSETFDTMWKGGPHGNGEILSRMRALGLFECLRGDGPLVPTFRNPREGYVVHQLDRLFVDRRITPALRTCTTGSHERVFGGRLSDHLPIIADFDGSAIAV